MKDIIKTISDLVAIPSQGGIDKPHAIIDYLAEQSKMFGCTPKIIRYHQKQVGLAIEIIYDVEQPMYVLEAVIDTAPVGDLSARHSNPFIPTIKDGWMYGRGTADSKAGAAIFLSLIEHIKNCRKNVIIFFDADEHTGKFLGAKALVKAYPKIAGVFSAYPGNEKLIIGSRGFYRAIARISGTSEHSGSRNTTPDNPITTACKFIESLQLDTTKSSYPLPPKLSVTAIYGGEYFSMIPSIINVNIDIRTTTDFTATDAEQFLLERATKFDEKIRIEKFESFPAYILDENTYIRNVFEKSLKQSGFNIPSQVSGSSNIGNLLAKYEIPMIAGFGVNYKNAHAANECIDLTSIEPVRKVYENLINNI